MEKRYEEQNTVKFQEKFELGFEIGLPVNETQFSKTTINNAFYIELLMETGRDRTAAFYKIKI